MNTQNQISRPANYRYRNQAPDAMDFLQISPKFHRIIG